MKFILPTTLLAIFCFTNIQAQITGIFDAVNDTIAVRNNAPQLFNILCNDYTTYNFDIINFTIVSPPKGTAKVKADKGIDKLQYVPVANDPSPTDRLSYQICNKSGKCDTASVIIYKCPEGNPSFPSVDVEVVHRNGQREFEHIGHHIRLSVNPRFGTIEMNSDSSSFIYTAQDGFTGCDTIKYDVYEVRNRICGYIRTEGHNIILQVIPDNKSNKAPTANNDEVTIVGGRRTEIDVLANDSDPEGNLERKINVVTAPRNGKIKYTPRGIITYTPKEGFVGSDEIPYTVCDYNGACSSAKVLIKVTKR